MQGCTTAHPRSMSRWIGRRLQPTTVTFINIVTETSSTSYQRSIIYFSKTERIKPENTNNFTRKNKVSSFVYERGSESTFYKIPVYVEYHYQNLVEYFYDQNRHHFCLKGRAQQANFTRKKNYVYSFYYIPPRLLCFHFISLLMLFSLMTSTTTFLT